MNASHQRLCAWSGIVFTGLFVLGFGVIARFIPLPDPGDSAQEVADMYAEDRDQIRAGMVVSMFALIFYIPFATLISVHLKRIEGKHTPLTYAQLGLGVVLGPLFIMPFYCIIVAALRPERSPEDIQQLNDLGFLPFTGIIYTIFLQNMVIGIAVLSDKRDKPIFPRWWGYLSIWMGILYLPACLDAFYDDSGPLAWNGILSFWLSAIAFFAWVVITVWLLLRMTGDLERDEAQATVSPIGAESLSETGG